jgi:hypothetical protein
MILIFPERTYGFRDAKLAAFDVVFTAIGVRIIPE